MSDVIYYEDWKQWKQWSGKNFLLHREEGPSSVDQAGRKIWITYKEPRYRNESPNIIHSNGEKWTHNIKQDNL